MKNLMGAVMMLCGICSAVASDLKEEDYHWIRTFTLASGKEIYHEKNGISCGGISTGGCFTLGKGTIFGGVTLTEDLVLNPRSTLEEFRISLQQLGPIAWEW